MKGKVYLGELERFGYTLTVTGATEENAREALIKEYVKTYVDWNGTQPDEDYCYGDRTYLESAIEDINITEMVLGHVVWD